jgi:signal transduction histidine kinase
VKISHRLYLTVLPAALAVLLLAALTYWGQYARTAPELVLVIAAIAVAASLVMTWANARFVARRLERIVGAPSLAGAHRPSLRGMASAIAPGKTPGPPDEIDEIERVVDRLSNAIEIAEVKSADREQLFERRAHDYALLLASIADASAKRLEEVRLPLHILLDNHFGELNENQEEMLGAARAAAEAADADMLSLRQIAALDLGEQPLREDRMRPSDIVDAVRPLLLSAADAAGVTLEIDVAPLLPAVKGDRALLQGALVTILRDTVASAPRDSRVRLEVSGENGAIHVVVTGVGATSVSVRWAAAVRVVQAHAGTVNRGANELRMQLPAEGR